MKEPSKKERRDGDPQTDKRERVALESSKDLCKKTWREQNGFISKEVRKRRRVLFSFSFQVCTRLTRGEEIWEAGGLCSGAGKPPQRTPTEISPLTHECTSHSFQSLHPSSILHRPSGLRSSRWLGKQNLHLHLDQMVHLSKYRGTTGRCCMESTIHLRRLMQRHTHLHPKGEGFPQHPSVQRWCPTACRGKNVFTLMTRVHMFPVQTLHHHYLSKGTNVRICCCGEHSANPVVWLDLANACSSHISSSPSLSTSSTFQTAPRTWCPPTLVIPLSSLSIGIQLCLW